MSSSRSQQINRRRLILASMAGGVAITTAGNIAFAAQRTPEAQSLLAQESSSGQQMFRGNAARTGETSGPGPGGVNAVEPVWIFEAERRIRTAPAVVDGIAYVGDTDGMSGGSSDEGILYAVDTGNGAELWRFTVGSDIHSYPAVADGVVYVGSYDGNLYAVDAKEGTLRWKFGAEYGVVGSAPVVEDGVVYFGADDGNVYAVDAEEGTELWRFTLPDQKIRSAPAVAGGIVYFTCNVGLYAVDAPSGMQRWRSLNDGSLMGPENDFRFGSSNVAVADGVVYAVSRETSRREFYAFDADSGVELWRIEVESGEFVVVDGIAYSWGAGHLWALANGQTLWSIPTPSLWDAASMVMADGIVYGSDGRVTAAVDTVKGEEIWQFTTPSDGTSYTTHPAVADGRVYVNSADGYLYALGAAVAKLEVGGTARVTETTPLRGGPSPTAVERAELAPDTVVTITDESRTTGDVVWWPISVDETGDQGWVDASKLAP